MGCLQSNSKVVDDSENDNDEEEVKEIVPKWRRVLSSDEARRKYENDGSLQKEAPSTLLELRGFLDDPLLMKHVGLFGKNRKSFDCFMCWVDINEFKNIGRDAEDYKRSKAGHIYNKYFKDGAVLRLKNMDALGEGYVESIAELLATVKRERTEISGHVFDAAQQLCLKDIFKDIFQPFKYSSQYNDIMTNMTEGYNRIQPDDFEYIEVLGQGGFGLVVHCKKKSTGRHYALKMQTKMGLLKTYKNVLYRVDFEKQALAACNHPYIVTLDYAFQTNTLVFLAMQLGTAGTLHEAVEACEGNKMNEERVRFYTAEIVLALAHIHGLGMIYRDLKPQNVLLNADGHIQLVDLGGIIDPSGEVLGIQDESEQMLNGLFAKDYKHFAVDQEKKRQEFGDKSLSVNAVEKEELPPLAADGREDIAGVTNIKREASMSIKRARSIMGTDGYMAIEIMMLKLQNTKDRKGYTNAVDWWSLGVMMFVLLTGEKPFPELSPTTLPALMLLLENDLRYQTSVDDLLSDNNTVEMPPEYVSLHEKMSVLNLSKEVIGTVMRLLDFNERTRLGSPSSGGVAVLKEQAVFKWVCETSVVDRATIGNVSISAENILSIGSQLKTLGGDDGAQLSQSERYASTNSLTPPAITSANSSLSAVRSVRLDASLNPDDISSHKLNKPAEFCWDLFELKQIIPPFVPEAHDLNEDIAYPEFEGMMTQIDKSNWLKQYPSSYYDEYFQNW
jgi:serine/threonine protein kinase